MGIITGPCSDKLFEQIDISISENIDSAVRSQLMTTRLMDVQGVFSKLDPQRMMAELRPALEAVVPKLVETIASEYLPVMWSSFP